MFLNCALGKDLFLGYSSAGRALEWHSRGQRFDPELSGVQIWQGVPEMEVKNDIWLKKPVFASLPRLPNVKIREP